MASNNQFSLRVDIVKGTGTDHIHLKEYIEYLEEGSIVAGEKTQIEMGDFIYINDIQYQVVHKKLDGRKNHISIKKWN